MKHMGLKHMGIQYLNNMSIINSLKRAGARMALFADRRDGLRYQKLSPRILPNGIKNSDTIQRVSGDVFLQASDIESVLEIEQVTRARVNISKFPNLVSVTNSINNVSVVDQRQEFANIAGQYTTENIGKYCWVPTFGMNFALPLGTTLAEAQALLTGTVLRYQLATPIDTLNTPPPTPWVDLVNSVGKNLFDGVIESGAINASGQNSTDSSRIRTLNYISCKPNTQYKWSINGVSTSFAVFYYDENKNFIALGGSGSSFTTPSNCYYVRWYRTSTDLTEKWQMEEGSAATVYEPYAKNNALMQGLANTQDSGMAYVPLMCETGTPVEYVNLVRNASLDDTSGFVPFGSVLSVSGGKLIVTGNGTSPNGRAYQDLNIKPNIGTRLFVKSRVRVTTTGATSIQIFLRDGVFGAFLDTRTISNPVQNQWYEVEFSLISTMPTLTNNLHLYISHNHADSASANGKVAEWEKPQVIYITDNPQITALESQMPNPLTALECDRLFPFVATSGVSKIGLRPFMWFDGINDVGILANNPSVDIVGTGDFAICVGFMTPSTLQTGFLIAKGLDSYPTNMQYSIVVYGSGVVELVLNGTAVSTGIPSGTILPNTMYDLRIYRVGGRLIAKLQNLVKNNTANLTPLTSQPNLRSGARSSNVEGTTHSSFFKGGIAWIITATGAEVANLDKALDRKARDYRMMG